MVGYICESDTLGYDRMLNEVRVGDILSISNAGAYGFSMANQYNARLRPAEVLRTAVILNLKVVMLIHNHPSGRFRYCGERGRPGCLDGR